MTNMVSSTGLRDEQVKSLVVRSPGRTLDAICPYPDCHTWVTSAGASGAGLSRVAEQLRLHMTDCFAKTPEIDLDADLSQYVPKPLSEQGDDDVEIGTVQFGRDAAKHPNRTCQRCGGAMPDRMSRQRDEKGHLVCDSCKNHTPASWTAAVHASLNEAQRTEMRRREAEALTSVRRIAAQGSGLIRLAHDSGDNALVHHCFEAATRYWTKDGLRTLGETVDTQQMVLTSPQHGGPARWVEASIVNFGEQPLMKVTLTRNQTEKVIYATSGHRWWVRARDTKANNNQRRVVTTEELIAGHRLAWALPKSRIVGVTPSPFGVAHGFTFGDGTRAAKGSRVTLWGEKDAQMAQFFSASRTSPAKTPNGVLGLTVHDLPMYFKDRPSTDESAAYLYGWLAGYFAADGTVTTQGQATISCADRGELEFVQQVAMGLGIATYDIQTQMRRGYGEQDSALYSLQFINSTLLPGFFLIREHRERFEAMVARANPERIGWTVVSVEETDRVEDVFCAVVPGDENFVLDGLINTMNCPFCGSGAVYGRSDGSIECEFCHSVCTVQAQPQQPFMPQTIDGVPSTPPGMPGGQQTELSAPSDPSVAENDEGVASDPLGGDQPGANAAPGAPVAPGAAKPNPFAKKGPDAAPVPTSEKTDGGGTKKKSLPPWLDKKKSSSLSYRTVTGATLPTEDYLAHLALSFADDREAVLDTVRVAHTVTAEAGTPHNIRTWTAPERVPAQPCVVCGRIAGNLGEWVDSQGDNCIVDPVDGKSMMEPFFIHPACVSALVRKQGSRKQAFETEFVCPACDGRGGIHETDDCHTCGGRGKVPWAEVERYADHLRSLDDPRADAELDSIQQRYKISAKTAGISWKGDTHFGVGYLSGKAPNGDIYEVYSNPNMNPTPCSWVNYGPKGDTGPNSGIASGRGFTTMQEAVADAERHAGGAKTAAGRSEPSDHAKRFAEGLTAKHGNDGPWDGYNRYEATGGGKYDRIVVHHPGPDGSLPEHSGAAHAFVNRETGEVHKADGWARPTKSVRYRSVDEALNNSDWSGRYLYAGR